MGTGGKPVSGTREWAAHSLNCSLGCAHDCAYCYAKANAARYGRRNPADWAREEISEAAVRRSYGRKNGVIMFPTAHDITPGTLEPCLAVLKKLLDAGNLVLVVSKPHYPCIDRLCREFYGRRDRILFRFTIGSADDAVLRFWEPGAPPFRERIGALELAYHYGFETSVSCEPMLDDTIDLVVAEAEWSVTDAIWLGKANHLAVRLSLNGAPPEVVAAGRKLEASQDDKSIRALYLRFKDHPKIKWKDSIKQVVGLDRPVEAGLDV
jgi:DNA repair photolyase